MPFGKFRGCLVSEIPHSYLMWLAENVDLREPLCTQVMNALGITEPAAQVGRDRVKAAYKRLAMKWHPDHGGHTEAMKALNDFYSELTNKENQ